MKKTQSIGLLLLLLWPILFSAKAQTLGRNMLIHYKGNHVPLWQIFKAISRQTGMQLLYSGEMLNDQEKRTINFNGTPLEEVLHNLLSNKGLEWVYRDNVIIVRPQQKATLPHHNEIKPALQAATITITGHITDVADQPIPAVSVRIKGTAIGTQTAADGGFSLEKVPVSHKTMTLVFSCIGYQQQEIDFVNNNLVVNLQLIAIDNQLNETVVKGYYVTTQRYNTGSVFKINAATIAQQSITNPLQALEGQIPGLYVAQISGVPTATVTAMVRGRNSIDAGHLPLYVVDGIPINGDPLNRQGAFKAAQPGVSLQIGNSFSASSLSANQGSTSPLNSIPPTFIESIEVLKDADATSIYGSRGANGVVLITTKKGKAEKISLNINSSTGIGTVTHLLPVLHTADYLALRRRAFASDGIVPDAGNAPDLLVWDTTKNNDFQQLLAGGQAPVYNIGATLSGGNRRLNFLLGATWHREATVFPGNWSYRRGAAYLQAGYLTSNERFKADISLLYSGDRNYLPSEDPTYYAAILPPNYPLYNASGKLYWQEETTLQDGTRLKNPLSFLQQPYTGYTRNVLGRILLRYSLLTGLTIKASLGYNRISLQQQQLYPGSSQNPSLNPVPFAVFQRNLSDNYIAEPQADYTLTLGKGKLDAVLGASWQQSNMIQPYASTVKFTSDSFLPNGSQDVTVGDNSYHTVYKYASLFGRAGYNWMGRYIANASFRRDGSSRFGPAKQFGNFGAVGLAWIFSEEPFWAGNKHWFNYGKIRGSYGTAGNDQIPDYGYLTTYQFSSQRSYGGQQILFPNNLPNANYSWELTRKLELAAELGFLQNRLLFTAAWFYNRTGNQLVSYPLSPQTGFLSYLVNLPALVQNKGWELSLTTVNMKKKKFDWNSTLNLTFLQNKLLRFPGLSNNAAYAQQYRIGTSLDVLNLYHFTGVVNGLPLVQNVNIDAGHTDPDYYGGWSNKLRYKDWEIAVFFNFVHQKALSFWRSFGTGIFTGPGIAPGNLSNMDASITHSGFTPTATTSSAAHEAYMRYFSSDGILSNASYLRLKNVSATYHFPTKWIKNMHLTGCNLYLQAQNLFTITRFKGFDPETGNYVYSANTTYILLPPLKIFTLGMQCNF
jgi:TonB-linked SusC/RagA family outer membrane protein